MSASSGSIAVVGVAETAQWERALRLVLAPAGSTDQPIQLDEFLQRARVGQLRLDGLLVARRRHVIVGAIWANGMGGRCATVWAPQLVPGESETTADQLLEVLESHLLHDDVRLAQALLPNHDKVAAGRLVRHGFRQVGELDYMLCRSAAFPSGRPSCELEFVPYRPELRCRLVEVMEQTYQQTMDCPQLEGLRDVQDVLDGYQQTGQFCPDRWLLVRHEQTNVGCLLLADHPDEGQLELVYMGLVPRVRGRGWGRILVRYAQWLASTLGREYLVLGVDSANEPAWRIYVEAGLVRCDRRQVYVKGLSNVAARVN